MPSQQQVQKPSDDSSPASANIAYRARPYNGFQAGRDEEDDEDVAPIYQTRRPIQQAQYKRVYKKIKKNTLYNIYNISFQIKTASWY